MTRSRIGLSFWISFVVLVSSVALTLDQRRKDGSGWEGTEPFRAEPERSALQPVRRAGMEGSAHERLPVGSAVRAVKAVHAAAGRPRATLSPLGGIESLRSKDPRVRCRGVRMLENEAEHDSEAREAIRGALADSDVRVRLEAVQSLADLQDRHALPEIRALLDDPASSVRGEAIQALCAIGGRSEGVLIAGLLSDDDADVRADAADAVGDLQSYESVGALIAALGDESEDVREQVIHSLGRLRAAEALPALAALHASSRGVPSLRLMETMRRLGDDGPYQREVERLSRVALEAPDAHERYLAIRALERRARSAARRVFRQALRDPSGRVRNAAARALRG